MTMKILYQYLSLLLLLCLSGVASQEEEEDLQQQSPQNNQSTPVYSPSRKGDYLCDIYFAPSNLGGWGVYAGRDFEEGEVVEVSPRYVPLKSDELLNNNVLDDFHYGFTFPRDPDDTSFGAAIFGMGMFYNHGVGDQRNVIYTSFGQEPDKHMPWASLSVGWVANRFIKRGEELLSSYGDTDQWFTDRGFTMQGQQHGEQDDEHEPKRRPNIHEPPHILPPDRLARFEERHCAKTVAGMGQSTWINRVIAAQEVLEIPLPYIKMEELLPLQDHPTAIAKQFVRKGHVIEQAPGLVVPIAHFHSSPLAPMMISWHDLDELLQHHVQDYRTKGLYRMKGIHSETGNLHHDVLEYYDDSAILPAAGNIGLVRKVGPDDFDKYNCRLEIEPATRDYENMDIGSSGLILKLFATRDIPPGEELRLNLPDSSSWHAKMSMMQHLALTGQPIPRHIVDPYNPEVLYQQSSLDQEEEATEEPDL